MRYFFILLFIIADVTHASGISPTGSIKDWMACQRAIVESAEAKQVEDFAGKTGVIELVNKNCGFRPTIVRGNGRVGLGEDDCVQLFGWSNDGSCFLEETVARDLFVRTLNPWVFDKEKYSARCVRNQESGHIDDYQSFRKEICEVKRVKGVPRHRLGAVQ
ncbi:hypothetical protein [Massilia sp. CT11-137]|uniref:hypothetical protein n=1 Tax=Massilia sp. CT11-137 TaxID=3393901 RepID=UPI0039B081B3